MAREGWKPGSRSNRNRNPGNLRATSPGPWQDAGGYRVFPTLTQGWLALTGDLTVKFSGLSKTGITPESTLGELIAVWAPAADSNDPASYAAFVADWLTKALGRAITPQTRLWKIKDLRPVSYGGAAA